MATRSFLAGWRGRGLAAALALAAGPALAVDLPPAPELPSLAATSSDAFSGWYLRGDVGAGFETAPDLRAAAPPVLPALSGYAFGKSSMTPSASLDAGLGYALNAWLRTDATLEYRFGGRFDASWAAAGSGGTIAAGRVGASVASLVALLNGYVDLGEYWGATPFVGVGVGVAQNALSGVSDTGLAVTPAGVAVPASGFFSNASRTSFAWAVTAGVGFAIAPNLKLELSYRYLNLGPVALGGAHCYPGAGGCVGVAARSRGTLASNDVRIGLVYLIGEPSAPVAAR